MGTTIYTRVCIKCGNSANVTYKPKPGSKCLKCAAGENAYAMSQARIGQVTRYTRVCVDCGDIKENKAKPKEPQLCATCSRKRVGNITKGRKKPELKPIMMKPPRIRFFRVCQDCGDTRQVSCHHATLPKRCAACSKAHAGRKRRGKTYGNYAPKVTMGIKPRKRSVSAEAIQKARQLNLKHKEREAKKPKIPKQTKTEEQMIAEWTARHEITLYGNTEPIETLHIHSGVSYE